MSTENHAERGEVRPPPATNGQSKAVTIYERMGDPLAFYREYGGDIAKGKLLGCSSVEQGRLMAMECLARRCTALTLAQRYHIIQDKLSMQAPAMLGAFRALLGGKHRVICRTPEKAEIELQLGKERHRFSFTAEEAVQEKYVYQKDGKTLKDNWQTPRGRMHMLWWRVVSEGVDVMAPEITSGFISANEMADYGSHSDVIPEIVVPESDPTGDIASDTCDSNIDQGSCPGEEVDIVDAEYEVTSPAPANAVPTEPQAPEPQPTTSQPMTPQAQSGPAMIDGQQRAAIVHLAGVLNLGEERTKAMICEIAGNPQVRLALLTAEQATALIAKLNWMHVEARREAATPSVQQPSQAVPLATQPVTQPATPSANSQPVEVVPQQYSESINGPCSHAQIRQIEGTLEELESQAPGVTARVQAGLAAKGKSSLAELSRADAQQLIEALSRKALELRLVGAIGAGGTGVAGAASGVSGSTPKNSSGRS